MAALIEPVIKAPQPGGLTSPAEKRAQMLRSGPVLSTLLLLTLPNLVALGSSAVVSITETAYVGTIGVAALGGIRLFTASETPR